MSIVERALQKAQSKARERREEATESSTPAPRSPVAVPRPAEVPAGAAGEAPVPSSREAAAIDPGRPAFGLPEGPDRTDEEASLTARDLKPIIEIDPEALRASGRMPSEDSASRTEDEIRRLKWPLLKAITGDDGTPKARNNVILVTSALPGEGKTFTSLNLALSIVRDRELRVVLVDGDVARPGLTPSLGLENRPGLNDALEDLSRDIGSVTYQTTVDGLYFVPAGKWHEHAPEFFAGSRMPQIIEALSRRVGKGVIIIDSPPLLATNEAQVATRLAGQVLMVVKADHTQQQAVLDALALVDKNTPVNAVLNNLKPSVLSRYYGQYYYGQGYGYGQYGYGRDRNKGTGGTGEK